MKKVITLTALLIVSFIMGGCSQDETKSQGKDQVTSNADDQNKDGLSAPFIKLGRALDGKSLK